MKMSEKFTIIICGLLATFFAGALIYTFIYAKSSNIALVSSAGIDLEFASEKTNHVYKIVMAQLAAFLLATMTIIVYVLYRSYKIKTIVHNGAKIIVLNSENVDEFEYALNNKSSAIIGRVRTGNKRLCFIDKSNMNFDGNVEKYAVVNCVKNSWYMECISSELPKMRMALKRGGKQCAYKLEEGYIYRLQAHDIIYIGKERLRFEAGEGIKTA